MNAHFYESTTKPSQQTKTTKKIKINQDKSRYQLWQHCQLVYKKIYHPCVTANNRRSHFYTGSNRKTFLAVKHFVFVERSMIKRSRPTKNTIRHQQASWDHVANIHFLWVFIEICGFKRPQNKWEWVLFYLIRFSCIENWNTTDSMPFSVTLNK